MPVRQGADNGKALVTVGVAVAALATVAVALVPGGSLPFLRLPRSVTVSVTLTPDPAGTMVEVVAESTNGRLPSSLDLELPVVDDVTLIGSAAPASGQRLVYSDVQDGLGNVLSAEQVRSGYFGVRTDGRRLQLTFHVASVSGRRIVYPIPRSGELSWLTARVYATRGTVSCSGDSPRGARTFVPCSGWQQGEIHGSRHSRLRLELMAG